MGNVTALRRLRDRNLPSLLFDADGWRYTIFYSVCSDLHDVTIEGIFFVRATFPLPLEHAYTVPWPWLEVANLPLAARVLDETRRFEGLRKNFPAFSEKAEPESQRGV